MDEAAKALRTPPQMCSYAEKHNLFQLMQNMLTSLVLEQPEDPISYLISFLERPNQERPQVMLLGPPAVGKHTLAKRLSAELGAVHVKAASLLQSQSGPSRGSEGGSAAVLVQLLQERLKQKDCLHRGWVMEGIPQTRLQVLQLQEAGILPKHVVMLETPEDVLLLRNRGKLIDPITGDVYHQAFIPPDDKAVALRLQPGRGLSDEQLLAELHRYRCEVTAVKSAYQHVLQVVNGNQHPADVYKQALTFVRTGSHFRTPRIVLLGPPGAGKSHLARLVSQKYKVVDVSCDHLLRSVAADGSGPGAEIQPYLDDGLPVPDSLLLRVLETRLSRMDCICRGWILHDFPQNLQQARSLQESQHQPNRVFFLEAPDDVCLERLVWRATDPVSSEIQNRLRTEAVRQRLTSFRICSAALQSVYPDGVHVDAAQDPRSVFQVLESRLYSR
ncbi:PREDICTED: adenylate kinase 8 [Cyprinodon variegatus]|uniref:adenylate kinase 8 n=1 Tax=Cyprinodon variegatus TaxID=28743 RepID=UPI000742796B|nr:PREDICTED: adenylate kinase 8 [Cyprinodon variegatus]